MINIHSPFFIPRVSPWPVLSSGGIFNLFCIVLIWADRVVALNIMVSYVIVVFVVIALWFLDIHWERGSSGFTTLEIDTSLKMSIAWFIRREVIFFFSFFFFLYCNSLMPWDYIGNMLASYPYPTDHGSFDPPLKYPDLIEEWYLSNMGSSFYEDRVL